MNYDLSNWHPGCLNKQFTSTDGKMFIYCQDCGVIADVEAISGKISPVDACKIKGETRVIVGKQSPGVDRGAAK